MRNLLAFLGAVIVTVAVLGWYLGWYNISSTPTGTPGHSKLEVDINSDKIGKDVKKGEQNVQDFIEKKGAANAPNSTPTAPAAPTAPKINVPTPFSPPAEPDAQPKPSGQSRAGEAIKDLILDEVFPPKQDK
ncbi:MAG TPA: hypothetical protein VKS79_03450 [Gemmataceae bacterium]|nr:hypothetical protein [Gemmataceae bacterium]